MITSCYVASDKSIIVTGDSGASKDNALIAAWDSKTLSLMDYTVLQPECGIQTLSMTQDNQFIIAIVNENISAAFNETIIAVDTSKKKTPVLQQHLMIYELISSNNQNSPTHTRSVNFNIENNNQETPNADNSDNDSFNDIQIKSIVSAKIPMGNHELHTSLSLQTNDMPCQDIVTNGKKTVLFWKWIQDQDGNHSLQCIEVPKSERFKLENNHSIGDITASVFVGDLVVSGTKSGDIIVWKQNNTKDSQYPSRSLLKTIRLCRAGINCMTVLNNEIFVTGSSAGSVRFFDLEFRAIGWLDYLGNQVVSMSFPIDIKQRLKCNVEEFKVPNMIVGTNKDTVIQIQGYKEKPDKNTIVSTFNKVGIALAAHPLKPIMVIGTNHGSLEVWNYETKTEIKSIDIMSQKEIKVKYSIWFVCVLQTLKLFFNHHKLLTYYFFFNLVIIIFTKW